MPAVKALPRTYRRVGPTTLEHKGDERSGRSLIPFVFSKGFAHPRLLDADLEHEGQQSEGDRKDPTPLADRER
jgi:hypothetical protein